MLIPEALLLLLTQDDGKPESRGVSDAGYGAATIVELVLGGRLELGDEKDPRVRVVSTAPTDRPLLDAALARLAEKDGAKLSSVVDDRKVAPLDLIAAGLERAGTVAVDPSRMLGLVPLRVVTRDPEPERRIRERLRGALHGTEVTPMEATLLAVLGALGVAHKVLDAEAEGLSRGELKKRIAEISSSAELEAVAGAAVKRAIDAAAAAGAAAAGAAAAGSGS